MGACEVGNFGNDDAADWLDELENSESTELLEEAFAAVEKGGYLESPDCCIALAAAEVVAAAKGKPPSDLSDSTRDWLQQTELADDIKKLNKRAITAVQRIQTQSELRDSWEESDSWIQWQHVVEGLLTRLRG